MCTNQCLNHAGGSSPNIFCVRFACNNRACDSTPFAEHRICNCPRPIGDGVPPFKQCYGTTTPGPPNNQILLQYKRARNATTTKPQTRKSMPCLTGKYEAVHPIAHKESSQKTTFSRCNRDEPQIIIVRFQSARGSE